MKKILYSRDLIILYSCQQEFAVPLSFLLAAGIPHKPHRKKMGSWIKQGCVDARAHGVASACHTLFGEYGRKFPPFPHSLITPYSHWGCSSSTIPIWHFQRLDGQGLYDPCSLHPFNLSRWIFPPNGFLPNLARYLLAAVKTKQRRFDKKY